MKIYLTDSEKSALKKLAKNYARKVEIGFQEVYPMSRNSDILDFAEKFFTDRGIKPANDEIGMYCFKSVGMHTDSMFHKDTWVCMIPVKADGELNFFNSEDLEGEYLRDGHALVFDDKQPHSYISRKDKLNYAILVPINKFDAANVYKTQASPSY